MTRFMSLYPSGPTKPDDGSWTKSTFSTATCTCVEVRLDTETISVRDSKFVPSHRFHRQPTITVPAADWPGVLDEVTGRAFPGSSRAVAIRVDADGGASISCRLSGTTLWFDALEWRAFTRGARAGQFSARLAA